MHNKLHATARSYIHVSCGIDHNKSDTIAVDQSLHTKPVLTYAGCSNTPSGSLVSGCVNTCHYMDLVTQCRTKP
eukprot:5793902-Amphidinium_carterae.1